ncbi:UBP1-associated protein 2A [Senna tora]|uniref:UBP1-associated protein 2A n=1 Tax=Senna tora TaxID=362788 RepID=A0A834SCF7_9FABA|nr:UBP1-associated protein 2A [Senna tora]
MGRKRKLTPISSESVEPPLKQQQQQQLQVQPMVEDQDNDNDNPDHARSANNQASKAQSTSTAATSVTTQYRKDDDDDEPILKLLEPFSKEQILNLLCEAANKHRDVADRIRKVADEDPAHRKIFVHGLGWDTTADTLINVFKQYGEIEDCKAVSDKLSGKSKGYGFILFKSRRGARNALKQPQKKIGNRMTACQLASIGPVQQSNAVQTTPAAPQPQVSEYTQRKIYVSNVGAELDPQKLHMFFSRFGEIEEGPLGLDKLTGKPKGFCLFVYKSVESARKALEEPHKEFEGHILHCQKAIDGPKPGKPQYQQHQNSQRTQFQRNENPTYVGGSTTGPGHLMAPAGPGIGYNQGAAATQTLNPTIGQALTALLATQGAGLGLTNLLGTLGSAAAVNPGVPAAAGHGMQGGYSNQSNISPGVIGGGYGNQSALQGQYPNQQMGQSGSGRGQHGVGQFIISASVFYYWPGDSSDV